MKSAIFTHLRLQGRWPLRLW